VPPVDYLVVGHLTADVQPDGARRPGGAVTYAAHAAQALGRRVGVVTSAEPALAASAFPPEVAVRLTPADRTTTFVNRYDAAGRRSQTLLALAPELPPDAVPPAWRRVAIAHLGPVVHELGPELLDSLEAGFVGLCPQGWLRRLAVGELVRRGPWQGDPRLLERVDAVVLSEEDLAGEPRGAAWLAEHTRLLVVTGGQAGAWVWHDGGGWHQPAHRASPVDPTGAGDTFATAFFVALAEYGDVAWACGFAAAAAAFSVEHHGSGGLPDRAEIIRRAGLEPWDAEPSPGPDAAG
jgi:sugar/nucleoside kinase (ribokinase family)